MNEQPKNTPPKNGDNKKPRNIWLPILIALGVVLAVNLIYNAISAGKYTETTFSDFQKELTAGNLAEVELYADRVIYMTKAEMEKPKAQQKGSYSGLPNGDILTLAQQLSDQGVKVKKVIVEDNSMIISIALYAGMAIVTFLLMRSVLKRMSGDGVMGGMGSNKAKVYMEKQTGVSFAPISVYFWGLWRKSMISWRDSFASS